MVAEEREEVFEPAPVSQAVYGVGEAEHPAVEWLRPADGERFRLFVEVFRPVSTAVAVAPARVPVVVALTAYGGVVGNYLAPQLGILETREIAPFDEERLARLRDDLVPRGYAFAVVHVLGTGGSEGLPVRG